MKNQTNLTFFLKFIFTEKGVAAARICKVPWESYLRAEKIEGTQQIEKKKEKKKRQPSR
jgi:hypothetical protein